MNILLKLLALSEAKGENLLGLTINDKKITEQTPSEPWHGDFSCYNNKLTSLEFCPKEVSGYFGCSSNKLTSLEFCPKEVGGYFWCSNNKLTSLEFCPKEVSGHFYCSYNQLTSLEFCPKEVGGDFNCSDNQLTSLEFCPEKVGGNFWCSFNKLTSLEFCPKEVGGNFDCSDNKLTSLADIHKHLKKMNGTFHARKNPIKSNVIGLMLVAGCTEVELDNKEVEKIINKHLKSPFGNRRVLECQSEMLEAELGEWAVL